MAAIPSSAVLASVLADEWLGGFAAGAPVAGLGAVAAGLGVAGAPVAGRAAGLGGLGAAVWAAAGAATSASNARAPASASAGMGRKGADKWDVLQSGYGAGGTDDPARLEGA